MRILATLLLMFAAAAAAAAAVGGSGPASAGQKAAWGDDSPATVAYLLDSAAADFLEHGPDPDGFRNLRFGRIERADEPTLFLMCGEVRAASGQAAGKWVQFATIRTEGYEQWLGGAGYCDRAGAAWEPEDLSAELQRRVDAARSSRGR